MQGNAAEIAEQLELLAERLAEMAMDSLREAVDGWEDGWESGERDPDPVKVAEERRYTKARRSVERAVYLLRKDSDRLGPGV